MEHQLNKELLRPEVQAFITEHTGSETSEIALSKSPFANVSPAELATQIDSRKRSQKKLPMWFNTEGIYFPPKLNMEQCSSQETARYKAQLLRGDIVADITGGFGVDALLFAHNVKQVYHIEQNTLLSEISRHNAAVLNAHNISFVQGNGVRFIETFPTEIDTIFVDPGRRIATKKVFLFKDTEPVITDILPLLMSKAARVIVKTSPLVDITSGLSELHSVSEIHIISVKNDCKELLWIIDRDFSGPPEIYCVALSDSESRSFNFTVEQEKSAPLPAPALPGRYIYDPDVSLLKGGCFKLIAEKYKVQKLHANTHLYTSDNYLANFQGRVFETSEVLSYGSKISLNGQFNIISRNFPLSPDEIRRKYKIKDGGNRFLICCTAGNNERLVIKADRLA